MLRLIYLVLAAALCGLLWYYQGVAAEYALFRAARSHAGSMWRQRF